MMSNPKPPHILARAAIIDQGHVLVCKTLDLEPPFYFLPGGHVDKGESIEQALLRELKEEIGIEAKLEHFLGCLEYEFEPGHSSICHNHEYNFIFKIETGEMSADVQLLSREKNLELLWLPMDQLNEVDFRAEPLVELLPKWLGQSDSERFSSSMLDGRS